MLQADAVLCSFSLNYFTLYVTLYLTQGSCSNLFDSPTLVNVRCDYAHCTVYNILYKSWIPLNWVISLLPGGEGEGSLPFLFFVGFNASDHWDFSLRKGLYNVNQLPLL